MPSSKQTERVIRSLTSISKHFLGQFAGQYEKVQKWNKVINRYKSMTYIIIENGLKWTTVDLSD